jgi:diguanylate cyclase (GGDEF)-like protein
MLMRLFSFKKYIQLAMLLYVGIAVMISFFFRELTSLVLVLELIPALCCTVMLWITYRYHEGNNKLFWMFIAVGSSCYLTAQLISSYTKWLYGSLGQSSQLADFFWNMQTMMIFIALLVILFNTKNIFKGIRLLFDSAIVIIVIITLSWQFVIYPNMQSMLNNAAWNVNLMNLGFSLSDMGIICCALIVYFGNKALFHKNVVWMLILNMLVFLFADTYYAYLVGAGEYVTGHWIDLFWSIGLLSLGLSGFYSLEYPLIHKTIIESDLNVKMLSLLLPHGGFLLIFILMLYRIQSWDGVVVGTVLALILILVQQIMVLRENGMLVDKLKQMLHSTQYIATHDDLSKLPNKRLYERTLEEEINYARDEDRQLAVMFMDLDRFKNVNDSMGHAVGDQLIQQVSNRLLQVMADHHGIVARQGGDEFTILVSRLDSHGLQELAQTIIEELEKPFYIGSYEIRTTTSIGIALFPQNGLLPVELLKHADAAMYKAKALGGGRSYFYKDDLNANITRRMDMERSLRKALEHQEFMLFYQPQVHSENHQIIGVEALIRWKMADGTVIAPSEFIPLAEETGLIIPIGDWVIQTVCAQAKQWELAGMPPIKIGFNVSPKQLLQKDFVQRLSYILEETGLSPHRLILEITENVALTEETKDILAELKKLGLSIAMDDFGTGFSSLGYLQTFQIDFLKIAQTFIRKMTEKEEHIMVVKAIMAMAKSLNLEVVVEGVETAEELAILQTIDHCAIQGYYFYKPLYAEEIAELFNLTVGKD